MCWMCADSLNTLMAENAIDSSSFKRADYWLNPSGNVHSAEISLHEKLPRPRCDTHTHTHTYAAFHAQTHSHSRQTHTYIHDLTPVHKVQAPLFNTGKPTGIQTLSRGFSAHFLLRHGWGEGKHERDGSDKIQTKECLKRCFMFALSWEQYRKSDNVKDKKHKKKHSVGYKRDGRCNELVYVDGETSRWSMTS